MSLTEELLRLRQTDPDVALVLGVFAETEEIYRSALEAMGRAPKTTAAAGTSAHITLSSDSSTANRTRIQNDKT